jgi:drug/metabolite transporter (DMT)-like permease
MARRRFSLFALVAILWGLPYLLIAIALEGFEAATIAWARVALAAVVLVSVVGPRAVLRSLRGKLAAVIAFAALQFVIPMVLIAHAEQSVPSSLVACLVATEPLWIALLASRIDRAQRTSVVGAIGMLVALVGMGILLGVKPPGGLGGAALVLVATASYSLAALRVARLTKQVPPLHLIAAALAIAAIVLTPLVSLPAQLPSVGPVAALVALALVCTSLTFPLWFALIARMGAARAALVTYASPILSVALGVLVLGEQPGQFAPLGLALILAGSWMASRRHVDAPREVRRRDTNPLPQIEEHNNASKAHVRRRVVPQRGRVSPTPGVAT